MELISGKSFLNQYEVHQLQAKLKETRKKLEFLTEKCEQIIFWRGDTQSLRLFCHEILKEIEKQPTGETNGNQV